MRTSRKKKNKGATILLRRRIIISVLLIVIAGFGTLAAVVLTKRAKADVGYDPYFTLSTGPSKIRIFQPLSNSVANESSFTASGTAPPNTTLTLKVDGVTKTTVTTDSKGVWTKNITGVNAGDHQLTASTSLGGPFSVIAATGYLPGYSIVDLTTNGLASASTAGFGTALGALFLNDSNVAVSDSVRINDSTVYLVRQRSVTILDVASQTATKTISLADHFSTGGENPQDSGELLKQSVLSADGTKLYLLYSSGSDSSKLLKIDTATGTLVSAEAFPTAVMPGATGMVLTPDGSRLYVISYNSSEVDTVQTSDGSVTSQALGASARDIAISPNGGTVYISEAQQPDTNFYIATIDVNSNNFDDHSINLGTGVSEPDTLYVSSAGDKFYVGNTYDSSLRVYDVNSKELLSTISLSSSVLAQTKQIVENQDGSKIYVPLTDDSVAIIDHANNSLVASILKPAANYSHLGGLMFNNNRLYTTYSRAPDLAADLFDSAGNPTKLFSSLAISDATTGSDVAATPITINGASAGRLSRPVATNPIPLVNSVDFAVGTPITITSPTADTTLDTATPTIAGKGPKSKTIQLSINGGSAVNVSVDSNGNWQKQVTLAKNKNNAIVAVYNNKRTQLVLPNTFIFGSDIAKNQLSVIDGKSGLETEPVTLPPFGISGNATVKINTGAAVNPSGQRYYVVNTDFSPIVTKVMNAAISGDTSQLGSLLSQLPTTQLGGVDVYSTQTKTLRTRIQMPDGVIPISMKVSPDGKRGMVLCYDIQAQIALSTPNGGSNTGVIPMKWQRIDLNNDSLTGDAIATTFTIPGTGTSEDIPNQIGSLVSGVLVGLSNVGSYTADGSKFYTSSFHLGKLSIIDTGSGQVSEFTLPNTTDYTVLISTTINPATNILYVSYMDVGGLNSGGGPSFVPGMMLINTSDNSFIGKTALPGLPLFNFAVNSTGSQVYMVTVNLESLINTIGAGINNPQAVLIDSLPTFDLTVYEPAKPSNANTTSYPITSSEVPFNLVLSPDNKQVFIPTIAQNVIHVFDVDSKTMDAGNAPIILGGISTALATTSNIGEVTLGSYNASASYFVPPDAPADVCVYNKNILADSPDCKAPKDTTTTIFKFLPSGSGTAASAQSLDIPKQTVQIIKDTAQQALKSQESAVKGTVMRTWLVYIIYGAFISILGATGYVIWRTDMLLGASEEETYM